MRAFRTTVMAGAWVLLAGLLIANLVTYASAHGGDPNRVHACVKSSSRHQGQVRIVDPDERCKSNEQPLDWNITGPQGPAGPQGPPGALSGFEVVSEVSESNSSDSKRERVSCSEGKQAISGAAFADGPGDELVALGGMDFVFNAISGARIGYAASAFETAPTDQPWTLVVRALCVDAPASS